jgi:hypothetical protein
MCRNVLKPGGMAIMVIGESKVRQSVIENFKSIATFCDLKLDNELRRTIAYRRRQHPSISEERILIFTRR